MKRKSARASKTDAAKPLPADEDAGLIAKPHSCNFDLEFTEKFGHSNQKLLRWRQARRPGYEVAMLDDTGFTNLILRVRGGDEEAAAELVRRYEPEIRREVRVRLRFRDSRLRRSFDSMDIVQSVLQSFFLRVAVGQYDLDEPSQLCALLIAMARNKLAEHVRFEQRECRDVRRVDGDVLAGLTQASDDPSPSRVIAGRDLLREFRHRLTEEERQLADLRSEGHTWAELSVAVGGTPEARRKQLSRAVDRVAAELGLID